jgi:hypothetical protein
VANGGIYVALCGIFDLLEVITDGVGIAVVIIVFERLAVAIVIAIGIIGSMVAKNL